MKRGLDVHGAMDPLAGGGGHGACDDRQNHRRGASPRPWRRRGTRSQAIARPRGGATGRIAVLTSSLDAPPARPRQQVGCGPDRGYGLWRDDRRSGFRRQPDPGAPSGQERHRTASRPRRCPPFLRTARSHRGRLSGIREFRHVESDTTSPTGASRACPMPAQAS